MVIDNFEQISNILKFGENNDTFYFLQIIKRRKDNRNVLNMPDSKIIKSYYINSLEYLTQKRDEIISLCKQNNARACINLNPRSYETVAMYMLKEVTDRIINKEFKSISKAYDSVCGKHSVGKDKLWLVDIDTKDKELLNSVIVFINSQCQPIDTDKVVTILPTKSGYHIITKPFNKQVFGDMYSDIDVHKNNPTILYFDTLN